MPTNQIDLDTQVKNTLDPGNGGTGAVNTGAAGKVLIGNGTEFVEGDPLVQGLIAHDSPGAASAPVLIGGYANAAAPADVSTDVDSVRGWFLRNGAQAVNLTAAGALIPGSATDGLTVNLGTNNDVTVTGSVTATISGTPTVILSQTGTDNNVDANITNATLAVTQSGTWDEVGINDSGNSITVDNATLSVVGGGVEATALRVTIASDSTGVLSVDDNGGSLTVDGTVAVTGVSTLAEQQTQTTALQLIDDSVATLGTTTYTETTTKGLIAGALRRDADTAAVNTDNEIAPLLVNAIGALKVEIFDGGDSHTVDGTVTANLAAGTNNIGDVDVLSVVPGTGATNLGKAIDTATGATDTGVLALATRDDALAALTPVDGDNVQLRTNARGATWVSIEDGAGGQITSFGGGTQYTEDVAAAADPIGNATILVRKDTPATITSTDGDNIAQRGTNYGAAYTQIVTSTGAFVDTFGGGAQYTEGDTDASITGTAVMWEDTADTLRAVSAAKPLPVNIVAGAAAGGTSANDDSAFTIGSQPGTPMMGLFDDTTPDSIDENDVGVVRMSANRNLFTTLRDAAGNERGVNVTAGNALTVDASATTQPISAASLPLPTGASTLAEQQTQTTHLATIAGDTTDIEAAVELMDNVVATLGTTTYTEATTQGNIISAIRRDADTSAVNTDNEAAPLLVNAIGALKVEIFDGGDSHTVDGTVTANQGGSPWQVQSNSANIATQTTLAAVQTAVELIDDAVFIDDTSTHTAATTKVLGIGAVAAPTDTALNANDIGMPGMSTGREMWSIIRDSAGNLRGANVNASNQLSVSVDNTVTVGSHAVTNAGTFAVQVDGAALTALQLIDDPVQVLGTDTYTEATSKGMTIGAVRRDADTTLVNTTNEFGPLQMDANGRLKVEAFSGETLPVSLTSTTITGTVTTTAVGTVADDGITPGAPQMIGGQAKNFDGTAPGNVSAEDVVVIATFDRNRRLYVNPVCGEMWSYHLNTSTAQTDTSIQAAPGANEAHFITDIVFSSGAATAINMFIEEGASTILGPYYLEAIAGRGMSIHFTTPKRVTTNTAITLTTSASIAHAVDITGYVSRVD